MPTLYRTVKIVGTQEDLQRQVNKSLATGAHNEYGNVKVYAGEWQPEDPNAHGYFDSLKPTGVMGCVTKEQLEKHNAQET